MSHKSIKIVVIGNKSTGKTSLIKTIAFNTYDCAQRETIGADFAQITVKSIDNPDEQIRVQLWDIAGQERYGPHMMNYCNKAIVCFIVCDVSNSKSIRDVSVWLDIFKKYDTENKYLCYLIINKMDLFTCEHIKLSNLEDFQSVFQISTKNNRIYNTDGTESVIKEIMQIVCKNLKTKYDFITGSKEKSFEKLVSKTEKNNNIPAIFMNSVASDFLFKFWLDIKPEILWTAEERFFVSCYDTMDYIIDIMSSENRYIYNYNDNHISTSWEMLKCVVYMLEKRNYRCEMESLHMIVRRNV